MKKIILFSILFLSLNTSFVYSQPQFEWVRNYPMQGEAVAIDSSGNIYVIGNENNYHVHIIKYKSTGTIIWSRDRDISIGGTHTYSASDKYGNLYFSFDNGSDHFLLVKYDSSGNHLWDNSYYTGGSGTYTEGIALDSSGNIFLTGESRLGVYNYITIKYNPQGDTLWTAKYNYNFGGSVPYSIFVDKPGNVYVTGISWGDGNNSDYATIKYNINGLRQWVARYNGPYNSADYAKCVKVDDEGYCYVTGGVSYSAGNLSFCTIKYTPNGDSVWTRLYITHLSNSYEYGIDLIIDENKNIYVTGGGADSNYANSIIQGDRLIKYDKNGNILFNIIDTNAAELPSNICEFNKSIYLASNSSHRSIYSSGFDILGDRIFSSFYPDNNMTNNPYGSYKILSYKNDYLLIFGGTLVPSNDIDSSIIIKYSDITGINNNNHVENVKNILFNNYPNPFNSNTIIKYQVDKYSLVEIKIFDILGREIKTLVNETLQPGSYEVTFDGSNLASGVYLYKLTTEGFSETKKMLMIK